MSAGARFGIQRFLNVRTASSPTFSPDGSRIAFISGISGVPQVWSVAVGGGWPEQMTFETERVGTVDYSPVSDQLVYSIDEGGNERMQLHLLADGGTVDDPLTASPRVIHSFGGWSRDGSRIAYSSNERNAAFSDIYVRDMSTSATRRVYEEDATLQVSAWHPDGRALLVSRVLTNFTNELLLVDLESGDVRRLAPEQMPAHYVSVQWQPDGGGFYCVSDRGRDKPAVVRLDTTTGELATIYAPGAEVEQIRLSHDGARLACCFNDEGYTKLSVLDTATGAKSTLPRNKRSVISELRWAPDGQTLAFVCASGIQNADIFTWDTSGTGPGSVRQVTFSSRAALPGSAFVEPETVTWPAHDGLSIPGLWYAPAGASGPLPTVVHVHGGPEGQARPSFNPVIAYLVNQGFGVLAPNVRGSTGYGNKYRSLDDLDLRMDSVADLKSAVKWLVSSGRADAGRIAVMGGSYGGFMTLAALTTYPDLWAAGVDIVGIANWVSFLENTGPWRRKLREAEYGSLENHRDLLERISPLRSADQIRAPLMVLHGANDPRVPIREAEQIVEAVRSREVPCEYLRFEDEGHGFVKLNNRVTAYTAIAGFLDRWLMRRD
jgi:dipeptidyl aminopeptidase/acylaminoacyl peptidase